ncbi:MAG: hypothetical protein JXR40_06660 [Pontiellaceae bacterium]|nr:hypothetical protein [Pontiellaceae bacterium]
MNFIFQRYPQHPWVSDWTFEPRNYSVQSRQNASGRFFRTLSAVGRIIPDSDITEGWALHIPIPNNSRINLLANGFCAYHERRGRQFGAEVFCPERGVLWGRTIGIPDCMLMDSDSEISVDKQNAEQWIDGHETGVLLKQQDHIFCLISKCASREEAAKAAENYLSTDIEGWIQGEMDYRKGAAELIKDLSHHDELSVICVEKMIKALRPAEGRIPLPWSQASDSDSPKFNLNELFPLAQAWSLIDPKTAEDLLLCALKLQTNAGALPTNVSPHSVNLSPEAPKPLMTKTAERVWTVRKNPAWLDAALPLLRRHIQWMLNHFDPKRRKIYSWQNRAEPIDSDLYESDLVSVDLAVFLLTEIEALNRLQDQIPADQRKPHWFEEERTHLKQSIIDQFWNDTTGLFSKSYRRGNMHTLEGFPTVTPLLWLDLPQMQKNTTIDRMRESGRLPGVENVLRWQKATLDPKAYPVLQHFVVFESLRTADPNSSLLADFSRLILQSLLERHALSLENGTAPKLNPATAALTINIQAMHRHRQYGQGRITGHLFKLARKAKADRTDTMIVFATVLVLLCIRVFYDEKEAPPDLSSQETQLETAILSNDPDKILNTSKEIIKHHPNEAALAHLKNAQYLTMSGEYAAAEKHLRQMIKLAPDSPSAMVSLGIVLQLQGKYAEAQSYYDDFCYFFERIYPEAVERIRIFRDLLQEGLFLNTEGRILAPPKWREVYQYPFMQEVELLP